MASLRRGAGEIEMGGGLPVLLSSVPIRNRSVHPPSAGLASPDQGRHFGRDLE